MNNKLEWSMLILKGMHRDNNEAEIPNVSYNSMPNYTMRHVWMEGYAATGEHSCAQYIGCVKATSHIEACEILCRDELDKNDDGTLRLINGNPVIWACSLFDNEIDARKNFG